jgi:N-acetylated-alpha-linked acidic dipeptidase
MPNENTPLIAVVQIQPRRQRYPHSGLRRFCTCILATLLVLSLSSILLTLLLVPECDHRRQQHGFTPCLPKHPLYRDGDHLHWSDNWMTTKTADPISYADLLDILITTPNETKAREWSEYYTSGPHLAGKNFSQAQWTQDRWDEFGLPYTEIAAYDVYINYPLDHRLALLEDKSKSNKSGLATRSPNWHVKYEASLEEDVLKEDGTSSLEDRVPTFHGYSASGNVTAPYVFVNYGTYQDYEDLVALNISLKGKIALAKYGAIFRGLKIKRAQELGMVGVVLYSDPGDDGNVTIENGYESYPKGPARNPSSVQRGSAQFLCKLII